MWRGREAGDQQEAPTAEPDDGHAHGEGGQAAAQQAIQGPQLLAAGGWQLAGQREPAHGWGGRGVAGREAVRRGGRRRLANVRRTRRKTPMEASVQP